MAPAREIRTCDRCRRLKQRCDQLKPTCSRCTHVRAQCSWDGGKRGFDGDDDPQEGASLQVPGATGTGQLTPPDSSDTASHTSLPADDRPTRKRQRTWLSCDRCHRLKVKCDKQLPCARCTQSRRDHECQYSDRAQDTGLTSVSHGHMCTHYWTISGKMFREVLRSWKENHGGSSHWRDLESRINSLMPDEMKAKMEEDIQEVLKRPPQIPVAFTVPDNYPFNPEQGRKFLSPRICTAFLQKEQPTSAECIESYFDVFHPIYPALDKAEFLEQVETFWTEPSASEVDWLSLLFVVLAFGSIARSRDPDIVTDLLLAAAACLSNSHYMFRPSVENVQSMLLMVVAKDMGTPTCWGRESAWSLLGMVIRLATQTGIDLPPPTADTDPKMIASWERGNRLWNAIVCIDLKTSLDTARPPFVRQFMDLSAAVDADGGKKRIEHSDFHQRLLGSCLPVFTEILSRSNRSKVDISYDDVQVYNAKLREIMAIVSHHFGDTDLRRLTVDMLHRGVLLILHRPFALDANAPTLYPESYWTSLECSVALFVRQHAMFGNIPASLSTDMIRGHYALEFYSAALTACNHLLRADAPLSEHSAGALSIPPRQIMADGLRSCLDIWERDRELSTCYRAGFTRLDFVLGIIKTFSARG